VGTEALASPLQIFSASRKAHPKITGTLRLQKKPWQKSLGTEIFNWTLHQTSSCYDSSEVKRTFLCLQCRRKV